MLLGYMLSGPDNDYTMFEDIKLDECARYKDVYTINMINPELQFKNIKYSYSFTYDGFPIVDEKFKMFCERERYSGIEFVKLGGSGQYYWLKLQKVLEFDAEASRTRFIGYNDKCQGYEEIVGFDPIYLKQKEPLPDGFFRTDLCFGSYAGKSPLDLVGVETKRKMEDAGFKKIDFLKVQDEYPRK